jgi:hypothetical protein
VGVPGYRLHQVYRVYRVSERTAWLTGRGAQGHVRVRGVQFDTANSEVTRAQQLAVRGGAPQATPQATPQGGQGCF